MIVASSPSVLRRQQRHRYARTAHATWCFYSSLSGGIDRSAAAPSEKGPRKSRPFSLLFPTLSDRRCRLLVESLRHLKVVLERGQSLAGPFLQVRIVAALGITLEQVDSI